MCQSIRSRLNPISDISPSSFTSSCMELGNSSRIVYFLQPKYPKRLPAIVEECERGSSPSSQVLRGPCECINIFPGMLRETSNSNITICTISTAFKLVYIASNLCISPIMNKELRLFQKHIGKRDIEHPYRCPNETIGATVSSLAANYKVRASGECSSEQSGMRTTNNCMLCY
uniref:Prolamin_like domain-containing protein n=1 Tax=Heterorhabditis bacteriophora TaxID=37862 RepID=A0A1I7WIB2_HETBA